MRILPSPAQGKPSAFSTELVGKYSAFEEIDLEEYLAVRERAVRIIAEEDPYAGLLISMHTYNLLTAHADRSTIAPEGLALLDAFLDRQRKYQDELKEAIAADDSLEQVEKAEQTILEHFRLLQACDNLSLLTLRRVFVAVRICCTRLRATTGPRPRSR